jgi:carbamoyltransferase
MQGAFLGPEFSDEEIEAVLRSHQAAYRKMDTESLLNAVAELLGNEKIVGWVKNHLTCCWWHRCIPTSG